VVCAASDPSFPRWGVLRGAKPPLDKKKWN
jgi:hypothetical protein